jgi:phage-related protein
LWYTISVSEKKRIEVTFFETEGGHMPHRDWLLSLPRDDRRQIGEDIKTVEFGWPIGMPVCKPLGRGLYEVRSDLKDRIGRVMFLIDEGDMVLLHGFIKKSQATPKGDVDLARKRQRAWEKVK